MKKSDHLKKGFINAVGVLLYVSALAWFMFNGKYIFDGPDNVFMPIFMLLLFIISASTTGLLVLGKPISLYLDGFKKEAYILLFITLGWLMVFLLTVMCVLLLK